MTRRRIPRSEKRCRSRSPIPAPSRCRIAGRTKPRASLWQVAHRLDIVAVGIENERAVIIGVILWSKSRYPIVFATSPDRRSIDGIDRRAVRSNKRDMHGPALTLALRYPEGRLLP